MRPRVNVPSSLRGADAVRSSLVVLPWALVLTAAPFVLVLAPSSEVPNGTAGAFALVTEPVAQPRQGVSAAAGSRRESPAAGGHAVPTHDAPLHDAARHCLLCLLGPTATLVATVPLGGERLDTMLPIAPGLTPRRPAVHAHARSRAPPT
jgi:hypothetical protein